MMGTKCVVIRIFFFFILQALLFGQSQLVLSKLSGFSGSVWKDCFNLKMLDDLEASAANNRFINYYDTSTIGKQIKNIRTPGYSFLFYETPWVIQEQKFCQIINKYQPPNCDSFNTSTRIYPTLFSKRDSNTHACSYLCSGGKIEVFTDEYIAQNPTQEYLIRENQKHIASYGQGLLFIYSRLVKDMLGQGLESSGGQKVFNRQCNSIAQCKKLCKDKLFSIAGTDLRRSHLQYNDVDYADSLLAVSPEGPAYGYVKDQTWVYNNITPSPCNVMDSSRLDTSFIDSEIGCVIKPPPFDASHPPKGATDTNVYRYFNPGSSLNGDKIIQLASDDGAPLGNISMLDCLCESLFTGAED